MASLLCICDQGYRASIEEQDDTAVWMAHMLQRNEGTSTALLLRASAVNYAFTGQKPTGVAFGSWTQSHPADLARDLKRFQADGGRVFAISEDLAKRGLGGADLIDDVTTIPAAGVAALVAEFDMVSFW
ncbi:MAG: hypothetical protein KC912_22310 [Proteobacteria bacterium]|nr:hypothetical protein [Pseudomonadota bacterium]